MPKKSPKTESEENTPERKLRPTKESVRAKIQDIHETIDLSMEKRKKKGLPSSDLKALASEVKKLESEFQKAFPKPKAAKKKGAKGKDGTVKANPLEAPCKLTPELMEFLQLDEDSEPVSRVDLNCAFRTYCYREKGVPLSERAERWAYLNDKKPYRDLRDPEKKTRILLDKPLKKLLNYDQYVKDVKAGKVVVKRKSKLYQGSDLVTIDTPDIAFTTITKLFSKLVVTPKKKKAPKTSPKQTKKGKKSKKEESEDEEEEEETSKKSKKSKKSKQTKKSKKEESEDEEEDDEEDEEEEEDDE